jgi:hypothetical protein
MENYYAKNKSDGHVCLPRVLPRFSHFIFGLLRSRLDLSATDSEGETVNIFSGVRNLWNNIIGAPSLNLERPQMPKHKAKPHRETREDRKIVRWYTKFARQEAMRIGPPALVGARLERTIEACSPKHLTITPKWQKEFLQ